MTPSDQGLAWVLGAQFGDAVTPVAPVSDMLTLQVTENCFKEVLRYLKTEATPKYQRLDDLTAAGFVIIAITNQSSIGRNLISLQELKNIHLKMKSPLTTKTVSDNAVYNADLS